VWAGNTSLEGLGVIAGIVSRRWRFDTMLLSIWAVSGYVSLTYLGIKNGRYLLPLVAPLVFLGAIGLVSIAAVLERLFGRQRGTSVLLTATTLLLLVLGWQAWRVPDYALGGIREVADFLGRAAPDEPVFYDGYHHGVFIFYVRARDPGLRRSIVRGDKLLYVDAQTAVRSPRSFVSSPKEVVEVLRTQSGCRWLAIEQGIRWTSTSGYQYLREAVEGPLFRRIASFPITGSAQVSRVDLYHIQTSVEQPAEIELPVPLFGRDARIKTRPIARGD